MGKVKVKIWKDELYPWYSLEEEEYPGGCEVEVSKDFFNLCRYIEELYQNFQAELAAMYENKDREIKMKESVIEIKKQIENLKSLTEG